VVKVAALRARIPPTVLVLSPGPLSEGVVRRLVAATGAHSSLTVDAGIVKLGTGQTTVLGVDPSSFRAWTSKATAESDPLWQSIAAGEGSIAHGVAKAFGVALGGTVPASVGAVTVPLRVGSFATTGIPGIGLVVNVSRSRELRLSPGAGLLLSAPQKDPEILAAFARDILKGGGTVVAVDAGQLASGRWVAPAAGPITSLFGPRLAPVAGASIFHEGLDIGAPLGAPVEAMSDGNVLYAGPATGFGQEIILSHRGGVTTVYGHMSRILVTSGHVAAGQVIALVGDEGESTGPHLHVEVRINDLPVDPLVWLREHGVR
jgi:murein DD-endopeptidase MepM/ murein hydrolase activator NlpD